MTSLHTKPPFVERDGFIETATGRTIAYVYGVQELAVPTAEVEEWDRIEAECAANLKLFLHAPELLAKLQYAVFILTNGFTATSDDIAGMLTAIMLAGVPTDRPPADTALSGQALTEAHLRARVEQLLGVVRFAVSKFCSPHDLESDVAARKLNELAAPFLTKTVEGGVA